MEALGMENFVETVAKWETFYLLTGTAAATLIGLLFVAVSINIEIFHRKTSTNLHHFAALTFNCFFYVLLVSIMFLVPDLSPLGLGIPLLLLGILGLVNAVMQQRTARQSTSDQLQAKLAARFNVPILCLFGLAGVAVGLMLQIVGSFYLLIVVVIFLLASASQNAWSLLVQIGESYLPETPEQDNEVSGS